MSVGFYLDQDRCAGCRACQVACKDKNRLEVGILYREAHTYSVGEFPTAKAYSYSFSCNHCEDPICLKNCPTGAIYKAEDGTVIQDQGNVRPSEVLPGAGRVRQVRRMLRPAPKRWGAGVRGRVPEPGAQVRRRRRASRRIRRRLGRGAHRRSALAGGDAAEHPHQDEGMRLRRGVSGGQLVAAASGWAAASQRARARRPFGGVGASGGALRRRAGRFGGVAEASRRRLTRRP